MRGEKPIDISPESRARAIASIKRFFQSEIDHEIGDLKAALVFDYILAEHGPLIYNQAIADARAFLEDRLTDLAAVAYRTEFPFWNDAQKGETRRSRR